MTITLVLGGARSGKSAWAEHTARDSARRVLFIATALAGDDEMAKRIAAHRANRPPEWRTIEEAIYLAEAVRTHARAKDLIVIDCLTLWVSNLILARLTNSEIDDDLPLAAWSEIEREIVGATEQLLAASRAVDASLLLISNEVGQGIVPAYPLGRGYRDVLGRVNQVVAAEADLVMFMIAGLPLTIKGRTNPHQSATLPSDS